MPSEEDLSFILSEELWTEHSGKTRGIPEATARILSLIRPAFEAKDAEIEIEREVCKQRGIMIREEAARADALQAKLAQAVAIATEKTEVEIRRNDDGTIDEVVACGAKVHLEQMDKGSWYLGIYSGAGEAWQFWLYTNKPDRTVIAINDEHSPARSASAAARGSR